MSFGILPRKLVGVIPQRRPGGRNHGAQRCRPLRRERLCLPKEGGNHPIGLPRRFQGPIRDDLRQFGATPKASKRCGASFGAPPPSLRSGRGKAFLGSFHSPRKPKPTPRAQARGQGDAEGGETMQCIVSNPASSLRSTRGQVSRTRSTCRRFERRGRGAKPYLSFPAERSEGKGIQVSQPGSSHHLDSLPSALGAPRRE